VNGDPVSRGRTSRLLSQPAALISYASQNVTLMPGDVIYTGTPTLLPEKTRIVKDGDAVEVEIQPISVLRNRVVAMKPGAPSAFERLGLVFTKVCDRFEIERTYRLRRETARLDRGSYP
jgi:hypothetical protein